MLIALAVLYVTVAVLAGVFLFVDLWAKSYDFPRTQVVAHVALGAAFGGGLAGCALAAELALQGASGKLASWALLPLVAVPLLTLLALTYWADWRVVYFSGLAGLASVGHLRGPRPSIVGMAVVVGVLALVSEIPRVRLRRYKVSLERGCSCCGDRQKAVHQLVALSASGISVINAFLSSPEGRTETRVMDEWRRSRPTTRCS
jgi:hypothetical protein